MNDVGLDGRYQEKQPCAMFGDFPLEGSTALEDLVFHCRRLRESSHGRTSSVHLAMVSMGFLDLGDLVEHSLTVGNFCSSCVGASSRLRCEPFFGFGFDFVSTSFSSHETLSLQSSGSLPSLKILISRRVHEVGFKLWNSVFPDSIGSV